MVVGLRRALCIWIGSCHLPVFGECSPDYFHYGNSGTAIVDQTSRGGNSFIRLPEVEVSSFESKVQAAVIKVKQTLVMPFVHIRCLADFPLRLITT